MLKQVDDYLPKLQEMFPTLSKKDIKRMVEYGWRLFYLNNLRGCDTIVQSQKLKLWMYCGDLYDDSLKYFTYYKSKLIRKLRVLYKQRKVQWDGYYYTYLTDEEYLKYFNKTRGRKRKHYLLNNKVLFKALDEARLFYNGYTHIVKLKYITDIGHVKFREKVSCTDLTIVESRKQPLKFKDILISNNDYNAL